MEIPLALNIYDTLRSASEADKTLPVSAQHPLCKTGRLTCWNECANVSEKLDNPRPWESD